MRSINTLAFCSLWSDNRGVLSVKGPFDQMKMPHLIHIKVIWCLSKQLWLPSECKTGDEWAITPPFWRRLHHFVSLNTLLPVLVRFLHDSWLSWRNSSWTKLRTQKSHIEVSLKRYLKCDSPYSAAVQRPCDIEAVAALHGSDSGLHDSSRTQHRHSGVCRREVAIPLEPCLWTRACRERERGGRWDIITLH